MADLILPGGVGIDPNSLKPPSPDTQLLANMLNQIGMLLQGVQMQLDTLIRMESNETSRQEVKSRIRRADEIQQERVERDRAEQEKAAQANAEKARATGEEDAADEMIPPVLAVVPDRPDSE